jgi:hypothetical protein
MVRLCLSRVYTCALFVTLVLTATVAFGKDGRNFGGYFNITDMTQEGDRVEVTLSLQIFNYSGEDLKQAVVTLRESHPTLRVIDTFDAIPVWRSGKSVTLSRQVTITRHEYLRWSTKGQPNVFVAYRDGDGRQLEWTAQLTSRPTPPL